MVCWPCFRPPPAPFSPFPCLHRYRFNCVYKKSPVIHHGTPAWRWNRRGRYTRAGVRGCNQYFTGPTSPVRVCVGIACIVPLHLPNDPTPSCGGAGVLFRVVLTNQRSPRIRMFSRTRDFHCSATPLPPHPLYYCNHRYCH